MEEFRLDLPPTHRNENRFESARVRSSVRGTAKIVATLDEVRPWKSLVWDASRATTLPTRMDGATQIGSKHEEGKVSRQIALHDCFQWITKAVHEARKRGPAL
jgi:hypothetical protein